PQCAPVQTASRRREGPSSGGVGRSARRGLSRRHASAGSGGRADRCLAGGKIAQRRGGRKRRAAAAAADRRRGGDRPGRPAPRPCRDADRGSSRQAGQGGGGPVNANGIRHFLDLIEIPAPELRGIIEMSRASKQELKRDGAVERKPLTGKTLAMIFDKPSTRTRVSFDVAMRQLGGESLLLTTQDMQLGRGETAADTARVLSRYIDVIVIRILDHAALVEFAQHATVPVINGLTSLSHPCQVM